MKIIHCLNQYMPLAMAGTEIYTHTLAQSQVSSGHKVAVITPHIDYYRPGCINGHYVYDNIDVYQYLETADPTDRQIHYGNKKPAGLENFKRLVLSLKADVIHFHELNRSVGLTAAHVKVARECGAKIVLTMHLSSYTCNTNILVRDGKLCDGKIRKYACSVCSYKTLFHMPSLPSAALATTGILCEYTGITNKIRTGKITTLIRLPSGIQRIKNELAELVDSVDQFVSYARWYKTILLENGIPQNKITLVPAALVTKEKNKTAKAAVSSGLPVKMVFVGRIQYVKGLHLIIEAVKQFSAGQLHLDIYGMPEETSYYQQCIKDSAGVDSICWKGPLMHRDVVAGLAQYDILCLASVFSEMSPLVIQEAFAAGIPVLASKVYGNMEQVRDLHNGILVEFNSARSLQEKLHLLVNNPGLIQQMKNNIASPVDFDVVNETYLRLYASLCS